jgi:hypothetical protein
MANTITAVLPSIFAGLDQVQRELIGMIPAMQRDATLERAAVGQTVNIPVVAPATGGNITPASVPPDDGDAILGDLTVTISKSKYSPVRWNGEEQRALGPTGQYNKILSDQFAQAFRWLANQVEVDAVAAAQKAASRAYGTAGTSPFGTAGDLTDFAGVNKILDDNGAGFSNRSLIVGSAARFNLEGKQSILFKTNEAGTDGLLRARRMDPIMNFGLGYSAGVPIVTKGTGASYTTSGTLLAVGTTSIPIITGTGTVLAGDVVTFAGDTNKYVVKTGVAAPGTIVLNNPGLMQAIPAAATAMTIGNNYTANIAFTPNALVLAARAPAAPDGGDSAEDMQMVTDPISGVTFEVRLYREYRRMRYEVGLAWGVGVVKSEDIAILLG